MKPRTKLQLRVAGLSSQLPNIENMMIDWAKSDCLKHIGMRAALLSGTCKA